MGFVAPVLLGRIPKQVPFTWKSLKRCYSQKVPAHFRPEGASENTIHKDAVLLPKNSDLSSISFMAYLQSKDTFTLEGIKKRAKMMIWNREVEKQRYLEARHKTLGPNLATAHFIVNRGGSVRFSNKTEWVTKDQLNSLPNSFVPNLYLEEIDASNTNLMYEGFSNFVNLFNLKSLILKNCKYVDDWCLDRFHVFEPSPLELLDLSGCSGITDRGLCSLHKLRNLKTLIIEDTPNVEFKDLVSIMIEDGIPGCSVSHSTYMNKEMNIPDT